MKTIISLLLFTIVSSLSIAKEPVSIEYTNSEVSREVSLIIRCRCQLDLGTSSKEVCPTEHVNKKCPDAYYEVNGNGVKPADLENVAFCEGFALSDLGSYRSSGKLCSCYFVSKPK